VTEKRGKHPPQKPPPPPPPRTEKDENDRPTINPPFDVEAYAREATAAAPESRRRYSADAPTRPPPPPEDLSEDIPVEFQEDEARSRQITLTNEVELEKARQQSAASEPPRRPTPPTALSMADARTSAAPPGSDAEPKRSLSPTSIEAAVLGAIGGSPAPEITERTIEDPTAEMRERFSLGDYTGALEMAELILAEEPGNVEASECAENCRSVLENMYAARLGPLDRVPMVVVPRTQMRWLSIDHRAGFVLSLVDGASTIEMILDMCGMPRLDALRILQELVQQKIVSLK
jgi:hypothetical protein